jgi:GNAT superfamily N-acetyltransferase
VTTAERIARFLRAAEEGVCDEVRPTRHGVALLTPSLPLVWSLNMLRVDDARADAAAVHDETEELLGHLGHRKLVVYDQALAQRLAPELAARGWNAQRLLVMVWRGPGERELPPGLGVEADRAAAAAALAAFRREQPFGWQAEAVRQLEGMDERYTRAVHARDFVAPPDEPAAACRLFSDGRTAQVDEVGTLEARRGEGLASAAVGAAAEAAEREGHDLVFLATDAADWPQRLYRRLGFEPAWSYHEFLRLPISSNDP